MRLAQKGAHSLQAWATGLRVGLGITHGTIGFDGVRAGGRDWVPYAMWHHHKKVCWWLPPQVGSPFGEIGFALAKLFTSKTLFGGLSDQSINHCLWGGKVRTI